MPSKLPATITHSMITSVLTGDLVSSTSLSPKQMDMAQLALRRAAEQIEDWGARKTYFTTRGGDSWQMVVHPPQRALRAALYIQAWLGRHGPEYATRISIATGEAEIPTDGNLNNARGTAFVDSGRGLSSLEKLARLRHAGGGAIAAATRLADQIRQGWSPTQSGVMARMLHPFETTQQQIATELGKSQQAINQTLTSAGYRAIVDALAMIEGDNSAT